MMARLALVPAGKTSTSSNCTGPVSLLDEKSVFEVPYTIASKDNHDSHELIP